MKKILLSVVAVMSLATTTLAQNFNWVKQIGGTSADYGQIVKIDASGNFIIAGNYFGTIDLDPGVGITNVTSTGNYDIFIVKLDANRNFIWGKSVGGSSVDMVRDLVIGTNNEINLCGYFRNTADFDPSSLISNLSTGSNSADGFILKLNSNGIFINVKQIGGTSPVDDDPQTITIDSQGNLLVSGYFNGTCDLDPGSGQFNVTSVGGGDIFIIKLDSNSNFIFGKAIGGTISPGGSVGRCIKVDNQNNIYLTGQFNGTQDFDPNSGISNLVSNGLLDFFILKLDSSGNYIYSKSFGGTGDDISYSMQIGSNDNIYVSGEFTNTADFDPDAGISNLSSNGQIDGFLLNLSNSGSFLWVNKIGGVGSDNCLNITLDQNENVFITGYFNGSVDFDNSSNQNILNSNGMKDAFLAAYSSNGNFIYAQNYGSSLEDEGAHLFSLNNEIYLTGYFQNTVDFDAGTNTNNITSAGSQDAFLLGLTNSFCTQIVYNTVTIYDTVTVYTSVTDTLLINVNTVGLNQIPAQNTIKIYPNPTNDHITINYGNFATLSGYQLKIENSLGQEVFQTNINQQSSYLNLSTWGGNGIYFVRIIDPQGNIIDIRKIVLQ